MSKLVTGNEFSAMTKPEQYQLYLDMRWELNDLQVKFDSLNTELLASRKRDKAFREWLAKYKSDNTWSDDAVIEVIDEIERAYNKAGEE